MGDPLDDLLATLSARDLRRPRALLDHLREAYTVGVPPLSMKSTTDRLGEAGHYAFHLGTPDPELRRIAGWLFTTLPDPPYLAEIAERLWKRHGREDLSLAGLLLANLDLRVFEPEGVWAHWKRWWQPAESVEVLSQVSEELVRAGRDPPTPEVTSQWLQEGAVAATVALVIEHGRWMRGGRAEVPSAVKEAVGAMPDEWLTEITGRIRDRLVREDG